LSWALGILTAGIEELLRWCSGTVFIRFGCITGAWLESSAVLQVLELVRSNEHP